jgi:hypothetical protein
LKERFGLVDEPGPKPVMGVDDLLLGLTHHWSRDRSVFPTEDDRLDLATIMLFQAYTACRPAELVDGTKCRGGKDPMLDNPDDEGAGAPANRDRLVASASVSARKSYRGKPPPLDSDSEYSDSVFDDGDKSSCCDSETSDTESSEMDVDKVIGDEEDIDKVRSAFPEGELTAVEESEPCRKHKALCYEDIVLWIVQDPNGADRDVFAMEVFFRHHKGVNNKPKPYGRSLDHQTRPHVVISH